MHGTDTLGIPILVINYPSSKVTFIFQLVDAGHDSAPTVAGRVIATADQLAGIGSGLPGAGGLSGGSRVLGAAGMGLSFEVFANLYAWLSPTVTGRWLSTSFRV